jgi:hypothetical protein
MRDNARPPAFRCVAIVSARSSVPSSASMYIGLHEFPSPPKVRFKPPECWYRHPSITLHNDANHDGQIYFKIHPVE